MDLELFEDEPGFTRTSDTMCLREYQMELADFKNASKGSWPNRPKKDPQRQFRGHPQLLRLLHLLRFT